MDAVVELNKIIEHELKNYNYGSGKILGVYKIAKELNKLSYQSLLQSTNENDNIVLPEALLQLNENIKRLEAMLGLNSEVVQECEKHR